MYCKECDMQNPDGSVMCKYCGARLQSAKPEENAQAAQTEMKDKKGLLKIFGKKKT